MEGKGFESTQGRPFKVQSNKLRAKMVPTDLCLILLKTVAKLGSTLSPSLVKDKIVLAHPRTDAVTVNSSLRVAWPDVELEGLPSGMADVSTLE